jgi:hypothetical protein
MSELTVGSLGGLAINNNVVSIPSGHILHAPGHVLQVVQNRVTVNKTITTTTETVGNEVVITPKFSNSRILVWAYAPYRSWGNVINPWMGVSLYRNSTRILQDARDGANTYHAGLGGHIAVGTSGTNYFGGHSNMMILDNPATTSAITYSARFAVLSANVNGSYPHTEGNNSADSGAVMIAMEIAQ